MEYTVEELLEAKRSIASTLSKCELTARRIKAFQISLSLIDQAMQHRPH